MAGVMTERFEDDTLEMGLVHTGTNQIAKHNKATMKRWNALYVKHGVDTVEYAKEATGPLKGGPGDLRGKIRAEYGNSPVNSECFVRPQPLHVLHPDVFVLQ